MRRRTVIVLTAAGYGAMVIATCPVRSAVGAVTRLRSIGNTLDPLVQDLNDNLEKMKDAYR